MDLEYEKLTRAALRLVPGLGSISLAKLIKHFGSAQEVWDSNYKELDSFENPALLKAINYYKSKLDIEKISCDYRTKGISLVIPEESTYPKSISLLPDAPPLLYYRGTLNNNARGIAIVGARKATPYGKAAAKYLGKELANAGYVIVSGLARGIDTAAHEGAIDVNGITWAFLGCGVDIIYPRENKNLAERIISKGALISEFSPGTQPQPPNFPARNRLISGASMGVIVAEAALRSGALITVDFALEQGREVFAVPGPIFSEMSKGTNQLLRTGAKLVEGVEDVISELSSFSTENNYSYQEQVDEPNLFNLTPIAKSQDHEEILSLLSDLPLHIDELVKNCTISPDRFALVLLELELEGIIEQLPGQCYVLARLG